MKPLKFKLWDRRKKEWLMGQDLLTWLQDGGVRLVPYGKSSGGAIQIFPQRYILILSIGRKDKNGKEIYDGDVLLRRIMTRFGNRGGSRKKIVRWINKKSYTGWSIASQSRNMEIIGNIYPNPELR